MTKEIPKGAEKYSESPAFTEATVPDALRKDHSTKAGVWALIVVDRGRLAYLRDGHPAQIIRAGEVATIYPEEPHHVTPQGSVRFKVEFYRQRKTEGAA